MRFAIPAAVIAAMSLAAAAAYAADVPKLDVAKTCRPIANDRSLAIDTDRCFKTEKQAREQLSREWANFPAADRSLCTQTATMGHCELRRAHHLSGAEAECQAAGPRDDGTAGGSAEEVTIRRDRAVRR